MQGIMENNFRLALIFGVLVYLSFIFFLLKKKKLSVQYCIIWLFSGLALLLFALFPYIDVYKRQGTHRFAAESPRLLKEYGPT